jgi:hypothetical protein
MRMPETIDSVVKVLAPHIGDTMARSATEVHCQELGIASGSRLSPDRLELRGGRAGEVWLLLLTGFVFLCAGGVCFAYFQSLGEARLDPFVHATFILAYALGASGARRQLRLLAS